MMISPAERSNFLRQCWRTRRWKDGVGTLLLPARMSLYGLRKELSRARKTAPVIKQPAAVAPPDFSADVRPIFFDGVMKRSAAIRSALHLENLFADVDAQMRGEYRLAGGRYQKLDVANLEALSDPEDHHSYHRLYWAVRYAESSYFGHETAGKQLAKELSEWLDGRWENSSVAAWPYTIAERIDSLVSVLFWAGDADVASLVVSVKRQIWKDAHNLSSTVEYGLGVHNHLLNDARGLYLASMALADCELAADWREQALKIWDEYFPKLVLEDGTFAEQSSHYHLLLCRTALEYWLASRKAGRELPDGFEARLRAMFQLSNELIRPDGSLPRFGDNSPDRTGEDLWGMLSAAYHYGLLTESPRHQVVTPLTLFYCGVVPELPEPNMPACARLFPNGGFAILRSPDSRAELVAHGDGREGTGPHGDTGRGSYELWLNGQVLIREPGSFFSSSDTNWRLYHGVESQNVTSLNGLSPVIDKHDARFLAPWYSPNGGAWKALPGAGAEFRCEAFSRLHPGIVVIRTWRFDEAGALTFEEKLEGDNYVRFESRICLGDAQWNSSGGDSAHSMNLRWASEDGSSAQMALIVPNGISVDIHPCTFLPEYGVEKAGKVLLLKGSQRLPFSWSIEWKFSSTAKSRRVTGDRLCVA